MASRMSVDELTLSGLVVVFSLGVGVGVTSEEAECGAGCVVVLSLCGGIGVTSDWAWAAEAAQSSWTVVLRCCIWS